MIISLRGTSGSGKSTLVRKITALYEDGGTPFFVDGRKKAYYTTHNRGGGRGTALVVPGHYDIANGGIDTLKSLDEAYEIASRADNDGHDVLMEGKNMSDGPPHALTLCRDGRDVRVVHILEPVWKCYHAVRKRGHHIQMETIVRTHEKCLRDVQTFRTLGLEHVRQEGREKCLEIVKWWLAL
jgi:ABC-type dipeptide/oligopeptide/nickel transport system ATPase component